MYSAKVIAMYIVDRCHHIGQPISHLKLQKILYFIQAYFLKDTGGPCFADEIRAWDYGPVVPSVHGIYKVYGNANIPNTGNRDVLADISAEDKLLLDIVVDSAAQYSASSLAELTQRQAPWKAAYGKSDNIIYPEAIKQYFH